MRASAVAAALALCGGAAAPAETALRADGTEFVLRTDSGERRSAELVGAKLTLNGIAGEVLIAAVERDPDAHGGPVTLHSLIVVGKDGSRKQLCEPDGEGLQRGFPIDDGKGGFTLACTSGADGKCVRWGYRPWEDGNRGAPMRALHAACMRMVRADYGGDGQAHTRPGVALMFWDRSGVRPRRSLPPAPFEAGWNAEGAVCVARPRVGELASLESLARDYPRLEKKLGPVHCGEEPAIRHGALLFNASERLDPSPDAAGERPNIQP